MNFSSLERRTRLKTLDSLVSKGDLQVIKLRFRLYLASESDAEPKAIFKPDFFQISANAANTREFARV